MGGPPPGGNPAGGTEQADDATLTNEQNRQQQQPGMPGGLSFPQGMDYSNIMNAYVFSTLYLFV